MSNILKRVASSVMGAVEGEEPSSKSSKVVLSNVEEGSGCQMKAGISEISHDHKMNGSGDSEVLSQSKGADDSDDDLFDELDGTVNRVILKANTLDVEVKYELVDIYSISVDGRLSVVGGFRSVGSDIINYIWLPASISKNLTESTIKKLKSKLDCGKKAFAVYYGMKANKYGSDSYDM
ncbi:Pro-apoptotic serine protease NMA111, partial [Frankliniella fusca]